MTDEQTVETLVPVDPEPGTRFERTFRNASHVFRYCYTDCKIMQILTAKSAFQFAQNQMQHPPRTLDELEKTGQMDFLLKAMAKLLRQVGPDGQLVEWTKRSGRKMEEDALEFLATLGSEDYEALEACKRDFFTRANILDAESMQQLSGHLGVVKDMMLLGETVSRTTNGSSASASATPPSPTSGSAADTTAPSAAA
jgi:hypothetical protein